MKHYIQAERFLGNLMCKPRAALLEAEMGMGGSLSTIHPTNVRQPGTAFTRTAAIRKLTTGQRLFLNDQVSHLSGALGVLISPPRAVWNYRFQVIWFGDLLYVIILVAAWSCSEFPVLLSLAVSNYYEKCILCHISISAPFC